MTNPKSPSLIDIERELVKRNGLHEFIKLAWPVLHPPSKPFVDNWHVQCIAEHVQAVAEGDIQKLLINIPPRAMKSLTSAVFLPSWSWIKHPGTKYIVACFGEDLSMSSAVKTKAVMMDPWYQDRWGDSFKFSEFQNSKTIFENDKNGAYVATSITGSIIGKGADIIICDDLLTALKAESQAFRQQASRYFWESLSSRFDEKSKGGMIVIQQRLHPEDQPGEILERERLGKISPWQKLILPLEYHKTTYVTCLGFSDPRTEELESLDKKRFPTEVIQALKEEHGSYSYAAMYQQSPVPREGGMVKEAWFKNRFGEEATVQNMKKRKGVMMTVISADCASKAKERNDPTVWEVYVIVQEEVEKGKPRKYHVELWHVERDKLEFPDSIKRFKRMGDVWDPDLFLIEDKDAGQQIIQVLTADPEFGWKIVKCDPKGLDKGTRMSAETAMIERGEFWLPETATWLQMFLTEMCLFTGQNAGGHDDMVDSASQFLNWFRRKYSSHRLVAPPSGGEQVSAHTIGSYLDNDGNPNTPY
jgi:predicted phage terminase large subunit-like protein